MAGRLDEKRKKRNVMGEGKRKGEKKDDLYHSMAFSPDKSKGEKGSLPV